MRDKQLANKRKFDCAKNHPEGAPRDEKQRSSSAEVFSERVLKQHAPSQLADVKSNIYNMHDVWVEKLRKLKLVKSISDGQV